MWPESWVWVSVCQCRVLQVKMKKKIIDILLFLWFSDTAVRGMSWSPRSTMLQPCPHTWYAPFSFADSELILQSWGTTTHCHVFSVIQEPVTTESGDSDSWVPESGCDQDDEDCLDDDNDGSGDGRGGYWDRMTTSGSRTSKCFQVGCSLITHRHDYI